MTTSRLLPAGKWLKTAILRKPHKKTAIAVFRIWLKNRSAVFRMSPKNRTAVFRPRRKTTIAVF
jgi:hypothetical protein